MLAIMQGVDRDLPSGRSTRNRINRDGTLEQRRPMGCYVDGARPDCGSLSPAVQAGVASPPCPIGAKSRVLH
jgi:hypothetical protein